MCKKTFTQENYIPKIIHIMFFKFGYSCGPQIQNYFKEVIQPQVPLRLPCYDFTPVINRSLDACLPKVGSAASAPVNSHGVTGGVYKARERIHRGVLIRDY